MKGMKEISKVKAKMGEKIHDEKEKCARTAHHTLF